MNNYRDDFPIFAHDPEVVYLDSAATAQRPVSVIEAEAAFYRSHNANPLRGLYDWSMAATEDYEQARARVASFIGAASPAEIIFTRNTTESLNLVAYSWGLHHLGEGDEIVLSVMEHHSNLLPWQMVAKQTGAKLVFLEPDEEGCFPEAELAAKITSRTRLLTLCHVSNVFGVTNPIRELAARARALNPEVVVVADGAQAAPHIPVNVQELGVDFYALSAHKLTGPMGIGVLYGRRKRLEEMPPFLSGGEMIEYVERERATYAEVPHKFEAGTVNAAGAVGLSAAIDYVTGVGFDEIARVEETLCARMMEGLRKLPYIRLIGSPDPARHAGIVTFTMEGVHPHDIASVLNDDRVCIRAGHHCAQPLMAWLGVGSTARASLYLYNTEQDVDRFLEAIQGVRSVMGY
ncbi:MAG: SufS family cysteine desulfurase [Butyrivibrio sp.]|nr:SufS family cysteine desulfurase [Butyrivibrio sp.]